MTSAVLFIAFFCVGLLAISISFAVTYRLMSKILKPKDERDKEEEKDNEEK